MPDRLRWAHFFYLAELLKNIPVVSYMLPSAPRALYVPPKGAWSAKCQVPEDPLPTHIQVCT